MSDESGRRRRRNTMRYVGYDYTAPGAYFVTTCSAGGQPIFGQIHSQTMVLNPLGDIAHLCWRDIVSRQAHIALDASVVMPNHVHALLWITDDRAQRASRTRLVARQYARPIAGSLSTLVGTYKAEVTRRAKRRYLVPEPLIWQRNFWDRIIRDQRELETVRDYIRSNPARWLQDQLHPEAPPNRFNRTWPRG